MLLLGARGAGGTHDARRHRGVRWQPPPGSRPPVPHAGRRRVRGDFTIDRYGDTTLRTMGVYEVQDGRLRFQTAITPPPDLLARRYAFTGVYRASGRAATRWRECVSRPGRTGRPRQGGTQCNALSSSPPPPSWRPAPCRPRRPRRVKTCAPPTRVTRLRPRRRRATRICALPTHVTP